MPSENLLGLAGDDMETLDGVIGRPAGFLAAPFPPCGTSLATIEAWTRSSFKTSKLLLFFILGVFSCDRGSFFAGVL